MPYITDIKKYTEGVQKLLKEIISDAYYTIHDHDFGLLEYLQSNTFKNNGVTEGNPELEDDVQNQSQDAVNKFNKILNFTWNDENDDLKDLKDLKFSTGETCYDENLDLKNIKIGNYNLNITKHQQDRINSLCDKIKSGEIKVNKEEAKKYFLIKFTLDVMEYEINLNIERFNKIPKQMETAEKGILFSDEYRHSDEKEYVENRDQYISTLVQYIEGFVNYASKPEVNQKYECLAKFNISEENYNKLLQDPNSVYDFDKDVLQKILDSKNFDLIDLNMRLNSATIQDFSDDRYNSFFNGLKTGHHMLENLIKVVIPKREWLTKFINGEYDPDEDHEEIKKIDEGFADFLKDTFNAEKLFKSFESDQDKKSLTAVQKLEIFAGKNNHWSMSFNQINSIAELCQFYHVNDYENKIPEHSVSEKFNDLKEEAFEKVFTDINNGIEDDTVERKLKALGEFDYRQEFFLSDMLKLREVLQSSERPYKKVRALSVRYRTNSHIGRILSNQLEKYGQFCSRYEIEDKLTPMFPKFEKEFLADFNLEKYDHEGDHEVEDQVVIYYNYVKKVFGDDLSKKLDNVAKVRKFLFGNGKEVEIYDMKKYLTDYIDLYQETFKDDLKNLEDSGKQINDMLEVLKKQIEGISNDYKIDNNKEKIIALAKCTFFCIGTLCTGGILAFALFSKDVENAVFHPIKNAKLAQIKNMYNETIKQVQDLQKKINEQEK